MKILLVGVAFAAGYLANEWVKGKQTQTIVVTAPPITRWDTVVRMDTLIWRDTIREDCQTLAEESRGYKRKWWEAKRELDRWNRSYQKLRREYPNAATLYSEILVNGK